jgi:hypothetical protein
MVLNAGGHYGINYQGIQKLNLINLSDSDNPKIN